MHSSMTVPHLPVLRFGSSYPSLDVAEITHVSRGNPVIRVSQANSGLIALDLKKSHAAREALRRLSTPERVEMVRRASFTVRGGAAAMASSVSSSSPRRSP